MTIERVATLIGSLSVIAGVVVPVIVLFARLIDATKCQLRSEMLRIYYQYCDEESIPQYAYENFSMLYKAYKSLRGNSFIEKIWKDIQNFEIVRKEPD